MGKLDDLAKRIEALEWKMAASPDLARLRENGLSEDDLRQFAAFSPDDPPGYSAEQLAVLASVHGEIHANVVLGAKLPPT